MTRRLARLIDIIVMPTAMLTALAACGSRGSDLVPLGSALAPAETPSAFSRPLRVVMFPYIPPFDSPEARQHVALKEWMESRFNNRNRSVEIDFRDPSGSDLEDAGVDIVELELTSLVTLRDRAAPWPLKQEDVVPGAWSASLLDNRPYAWPTYTCTNVIYSTESSIRDVDSLDELRAFLRSGARNAAPLAADFWGGSTTPALFVDSALDNKRGPLPVATDTAVVTSLRELFQLCGALDLVSNTCLNDSADAYKGRLDGFGRLRDGSVRGIFGYSEFAYYLLRPPSQLTPQALSVISAPLGSHSQPLLFVDGLVLNKRCAADEACHRIALEFARFVTSPEIQLSIAFGHDDDARSTPRYLLMAQESFWRQQQVKKDPIYAQLRGTVSQAVPMVHGAHTREAIWGSVTSP
jgi:hypothetical protein